MQIMYPPPWGGYIIYDDTDTGLQNTGVTFTAAVNN